MTRADRDAQAETPLTDRDAWTDRSGRPLRNDVRRWAAEARAGRFNRREFLAWATMFGASSATAYALLGQPTPAKAQFAGTPQQGGVLRVSMNVRAITDPRLYDWAEMANVARQFAENLVRWRSDYTFEPRLLEDWEITPDAKTYELRLRRDATWSNGDAFTAEDVAFNVRRWCEKSVPGNSMAARFAALIDDSVGRAKDSAIVIVDDHTLRLNLERPDATLIASMTDYPALIVHRDFERDGGDLAANPVGTGPFELVDVTEYKRAEVKRRTNGSWWGGEAYLDGVIWIDHGTDPAAEVAAFQNGEIDLNFETAPEVRDDMDDLGLSAAEQVTGATIVCRTRVEFPPYDDVRVRRALQLAVDNEDILYEGYYGAGEPAENHHVGPVHPEYFDLPEKPQRDVEAARRLLEEAGALDYEHELISIDDGWRRLTTDAIAAQLREAGVKVRRTNLPGPEYWDAWVKHPFSTTNWYGRALGIQILALAYRSGEAWNETALNDPEFDAALADAVKILDPTERRAAMEKVQRILQESGVIIQPYWQSILKHMSPKVRGEKMHQSFEMHFDLTWLDGA